LPGRVTGINVAYIPPEQRAVSIGFATPSPVVREVVGQLLDDGKAEHAYLCTSVTPVGADACAGTEGGVVIASVEESGRARSRLRAGGDQDDAMLTPADRP
jgi:S1-C subfamily serine protease